MTIFDIINAGVVIGIVCVLIVVAYCFSDKEEDDWMD